jgi:mono/diheme cytochrome c family protein
MRCAGAWLGASLLLATAASAQTAAALYQGADLALGERLMRENRCAECHSRKVGGDGSGIYRPQGRINSPGGAAWSSSATWN